MLFLFKKRKKVETPPNLAQDRIARWIVGTCLRMQTRWAAWMQHRINPLSAKTKLALLVLFIILTGVGNLYSILAGFLTRSAPVAALHSFQKSAYASQLEGRMAPLIRKNEDQRTDALRAEMNSLAHNASGKGRFDSLLITRPSFVDSLFRMKTVYPSRSNQKTLKK